MSALEAAAGAPIGLDPLTLPPDVPRHPLAALEEAVAQAVASPPCHVAFSGGRDSSLVLAAAVRVAAREGHPLPIAATLRFERGSEAEEDAWQELVLDHLGIEEQIVVSIPHELDFVGRVATAELVRRGPLFPPNSHSLAPLLARVGSGSLLVGSGGDELLGRHRWTHLNDALAGRRRLARRDLGRLGVASLPGRVRARLLLHEPPARPWVRSAPAQDIRKLERRFADEPVRFNRAVLRAASRRISTVARASLDILAASSGVRIEAPLLDPRFVAALARAGGPRGWGGRAATMRAIAAGVLPEALLNRRFKAAFNATFFSDATRDFARRWSGGGVDSSLVDPDALRREWLGESPNYHSAVLLQLAWLHDHGLEAAPTTAHADHSEGAANTDTNAPPIQPRAPIEKD
jgi:asparagine synthase (glutamine-hydrolysing)